MAKSILSSHLKEDSRDEFVNRLKSNRDLFERVGFLLEEGKEKARNTQISNSSYDSPAWSERQADLNGYQRAMEEIKQLIKI